MTDRVRYINILFRSSVPGGHIPPQNIPTIPNAVQVNPSNSNIVGNAKVSNAPWHKAQGIRPTYSSATVGAKVNVSVKQITISQPGIPKKTAPVPVSTPAVGPKAPSVAPKEEWSSNIKIYVERAFLSCKTPAQRDIMEQILRLKIKDAIASERMSKINWENEPIPQLPGGAIPLQTGPLIKGKQQKSAPVIQPAATLTADDKKRLERAKRFDADHREYKKQQEQNQISLQNVRIEDNQGDVLDWDEYTIVGTCQKLEKPYLRLTSAPDPATVRPLPVLKLALKMLKDKWRAGVDYGYICDQFKSLRQDMTVQRIKSDFTVQVYEIHARIAIEQGDLGQYNQCQTQLKDLYSVGITGSEMEFLAYRLLYLIHCRNKQAINQFMSELSDEQRQNQPVSHALNVRSAVAVGNYSQLFKLHGEAPNMSAYLMDLFIPRERSIALITMLKAYRPTLSISHLTKLLGFSSDDQCRSWLNEDLYNFDCSGNVIDCKTALTVINSK